MHVGVVSIVSCSIRVHVPNVSIYQEHSHAWSHFMGTTQTCTCSVVPVKLINGDSKVVWPNDRSVQ